MFKNKSYCVRSGNKAISFTMLRGRGTNSVHSPRNKPLWLHHYPLYWNCISSHNEDNGTYPQQFIKGAVWVPYRRGHEGTPGYFTQFYHNNPNSLYPVEFNFDLILWVGIRYSNSNSKWIAYRLTNFDTLRLTEEDRSVVRSDWGPLDGQEDPLMSEQEQIEPISEEISDSKDIHILTTDLLDQEEQHLATLAGQIPAEEIAQTPIIP